MFVIADFGKKHNNVIHIDQYEDIHPLKYIINIESFMIIPDKTERNTYKTLLGNYVRITLYNYSYVEPKSICYTFPSHRLEGDMKLYIDKFKGERKIKENIFLEHSKYNKTDPLFKIEFIGGKKFKGELIIEFSIVNSD